VVAAKPGRSHAGHARAAVIHSCRADCGSRFPRGSSTARGFISASTPRTKPRFISKSELQSLKF